MTAFEIREVLKTVAQTSPTQANRLFELIRASYRLASYEEDRRGRDHRRRKGKGPGIPVKGAKKAANPAKSVREAVMALLGPSAADFPEDNKRVMLSLAAVIEPRLWTAPRVIGVGPLIRGEGALLHALTSDIADRTNLVPYGGPVRRASTDQLRSVRFKAHQLKAALRDLPPEVREDYGMALRTDLDKDFIPKLERLEVQARLWERGEVRSGVFTSKGLKSYLEERIAYTLVLHGVPLGGNGERFGSGPKHSEDLTARGTLRCR